ncbi:ArsR/SmtB family transcription factor [Streptomyces sp. NPDC013953]|uniref:ArsR/SmtB family transcription factor n=1 Tax=Streptomyces sp. NPDC013953 TaxID=3364868 RepID=UPI0036FF8927
MIRIHFTADDFARVRFPARPAPLQELNTAFLRLFRPGGDLLIGRWRQRLLRSLPPAAAPLADLVPAAVAPRFLDVFGDGLEDALDGVRAARPAFVRSELERAYAHHTAPVPPWIRGLHRGDADAWQRLRAAQSAAFGTVLGPVWDVVRDLYRAEFTRHAVAVAEHGVGAALTGLVPGSRLRGGVWEWEAAGQDAPGEQDIELNGRGLLLLPTFHWTGHPLLADPPGGPLGVTYPAGTGLPPTPYGPGGPHEALAGVLGRTRLDILLLLAEQHTTGGLARRLRVSDATVSAHTAALRAAGLITTVRAGKSVLHERTALGGLLTRDGVPVRETLPAAEAVPPADSGVRGGRVRGGGTRGGARDGR